MTSPTERAGAATGTSSAAPAGSPDAGPSAPRAVGRVEESRRLDERVWSTRLADGPLVLSERVEGVRSVSLGFWIPQGAAHEEAAARGASHLLEHLVFKGTARRSARRIALDVERVGGALDAFTTHEFTAFEARVPSDALDLSLDVLADLVYAPRLRAADLELERQVVLEELAEVEDSPAELAFELHAELLYGDHPYARSILGTPETVGALDRETLRRLHAERYAGGRTVVAAAGDVDHDALVERVRSLVPTGAGTPPPDVPAVAAAPGGFRRVRRPGGRQAHLLVGAPTVPQRDPLRYAVVLADAALGSGMSSRLFQRIREEMGLAYSVYSFHAFHAAGGHAGAYVGTGPSTVERARDVLLEELRRVAEGGLSEREVGAAKTQLRGRIALAMESPPARMARLAGLALYGEPYRGLEEVARRIGAITREEIREATGLLHPDRLTVLELTPEQGESER